MNDEPLGCLLGLLWLPYEAWQRMTGSSRIGTSEMDREAGRFWKKFAIVGTIAILLGTGAWIWWSEYKS